MQLVARLRDTDPRRVGPFAIELLLGVGGFGVVYLGRATNGSLVAVKVMSAELAGGEERREHRARFRREVEFLRLLSHRFVPRVVESGEHRGRPYLATQFVPGPTLHRLVTTSGALPVEAVAALAVGLAEIVHDVHELGVHRDVKPGNVLITPAGPHLIDFGLAHLHNAVHITRQGTFLGTREYMDPGGGMPADVFGLGGTLLFAATGHPPFDTAPPDPPARQINLSGVPDELRELLASCLHATPSQRPRALAVLEQVRAQHGTTPFAAALPVRIAQALEHAAAPYTAPPAPPPVRSHPRPRAPRAVPADPPTLWRRQLSDWVQAVVAAPAGQVLVVTADGAITALAEHDGTQRWQVTLPAATTGAVAITGSRVYAGAEDGYLHVLGLREGRHLPRLHVGGRVSSCVLAGQQVLAAASNGALAAFDATTGAHAWDDSLPCTLTGGLAVAGRMVYAGGGDGVVYAIDTARNGQISSFPSVGQRIHAVAVSRCGVHVAGADGGVVSVSLNGSAPGWQLAADGGQVWACRADPTTTLVATASVEGVLRVDDAATGRNHLSRADIGAIRRSLTLHEGTVLVGCVSGSLIALDVRDGTELRRQDGHSPMNAPAVVTGSGVIVGGWLDGTVVGIPKHFRRRRDTL